MTNFDFSHSSLSRRSSFVIRHSPVTIRQATLLLVCSFLLSGCAGYTLGPVGGGSTRAKSVQVMPFANQTLQPRLTDAVAEQLRKQIQQDGTYHLTHADDADIIITGAITTYSRFEVSFVPSDVLTVQDYRLGLTARVIARERGTGKVILDQPVTGFTLARAGNDLPSAERQALPLLAADFARKVTSLLAEGSW
jgi:hypothetical protein